MVSWTLFGPILMNMNHISNIFAISKCCLVFGGNFWDRFSPSIVGCFIEVWDLRSGKTVMPLAAHGKQVRTKTAGWEMVVEKTTQFFW